jgi:ABC-type multidrug transport system ATPase subunit
VDSGKYLVGKITSYVDERDHHAPTLTVRETLEFAWRCTTGGHHSYNVARDSTSAEVLDRADLNLVKVQEVLHHEQLPPRRCTWNNFSSQQPYFCYNSCRT